MIEAEVQIVNRLGLHARAAARFVHLATTFKARVTVTRDSARADGKSILGLLTLAAPRGSKLRLMAEGEDAAQAIDDLSRLIRERFGEDG